MSYKDPEKQKESSRNRHDRLKNDLTYREKHKQYANKHYLKYKEKYKIKYQNNKEEIKYRSWKNRIKRQFSLTVDDYNNMVTYQGGVCAICSSTPKRRLSIDHDHKNGKIRGLLCRQCNYNLGWYEQCQQEIENYLKNN